MATISVSLTGAERLPDADYSVAHRTPPPVPLSSSHNHSTIAGPPYDPAVSGAQHRSPNTPARHPSAQQQQQQQQPQQSPPDSTANPGARKRSGSFTRFLRRNSTSHETPVPAITQAHYQAAEAAAAASSYTRPRPVTSHGPASPNKSAPPKRKDSSVEPRKPSMLRKISSRKQEREQERLRAESQRQKEPPRIPSPNIQGFNSGFPPSSDPSASPPRVQPGNAPMPPANFSRPGGYSIMNSSSPAYATRNGAPSSSPPATATSANGGYAESMANRGRYSYASSIGGGNVNSPRRVRRRKDPTPFNVLVIGGKNSGKTSFISLLRHSLVSKSKKDSATNQQVEQQQQNTSQKASYTSQYLETEIDGERVGVTLWDSAGLEKNIVDLQLREMAAFVESKFEETFIEEQKVMRSPGAKDTHIHCVFLVLDPVRLDSTINASRVHQGMANGGLDDDLDLQVIRALWGKTTVIPVISKADTLTMGHMAFLKRAVSNALRAAKLDPLEALEVDEDEEDEDDTILEEPADTDEPSEEQADDDAAVPLQVSKTRKSNGHKRNSSISAVLTANANSQDEAPYLPMSILSPDPYDLPPFTPADQAAPEKLGRRFAWGFADPYDAKHCDFIRLRDSIFTEWRGDLRDLARTKWYENWRTSRLKHRPGSDQRVKGGVTPVNSVPGGGRMTSPSAALREYSGNVGGGAAIPRSVSTNTTKTAVAGATPAPMSENARAIPQR